MEPIWTVYCHMHVASGRRYVGLTKKTMMERWNQHVYCAERKAGKGCAHFWAAIRKYGRDAFLHEVLGTFDYVEAANAAEKRWIEELGTRDPGRGFNLAKGGAHTPHPVRNPWDRPEFREKSTIASRKTWSDPLRILRHSEITKNMWRNAEYEKVHSEKAKDQWSNPLTREKNILATRKKSSSPEFRAKARARWDSSSYRARCSVPLQERDSREKLKTHCKNGHEYTSENTLINRKRGGRSCRACKNEQKNARQILSKTHCKNGHELIPGNFHLNKQGARICSVCGPKLFHHDTRR